MNRGDRSRFSEETRLLLAAMDLASCYEGEQGEELDELETLLRWSKWPSAGPDDEKHVKAEATKLAARAIERGDASTLRHLANILEGVSRPAPRPLTPAQENVVGVMVKYYSVNQAYPSSYGELIAFSKEIGKPVSKSVLSEFPLPLPIGKGAPGPKPS
jgi:hypothetical protein